MELGGLGFHCLDQSISWAIIRELFQRMVHTWIINKSKGGVLLNLGFSYITISSWKASWPLNFIRNYCQWWRQWSKQFHFHTPYQFDKSIDIYNFWMKMIHDAYLSWKNPIQSNHQKVIQIDAILKRTLKCGNTKINNTKSYLNSIEYSALCTI